jgi:DNA-binding response OmpR family regulator
MARILIGNDDADLMAICQAVLEDDGHVVEIVMDGIEAVDLARQLQPDAIIVDWVMPKMDGATAIAALRRDASTKHIPILMISGSEGGAAKATEAGADFFLRKPFQASDLVESVRSLLRGTRETHDSGAP